MTFFKRKIEGELLKLTTGYPVVTVVGPRQSGKTTLVRRAFPNKPYVNLESPDVRELAQTDPRGFLEPYERDGAIFDEIQRVPSLLSYIQVLVDERRKTGMFILTGSHQLELHQAISQSLAGRTALLHLLPMSLTELSEAGFKLPLDELLLKGGYPRIFSHNLEATSAYRSYFQTYVERDVRQLMQVKDLTQFQRFVRTCAGRIGQPLNLEGLGSDVGVSAHTVKHWLSILEASFVIVRLLPYYENFGKRLTKASKLYFTDVGLASYLLGIETEQQMSRDPLRGHLFENLVVTELAKSRLNRGLDPNLYFFRDAHGNEVDVVYQAGRQLIPIEIKSSKTFTAEFLKPVRFFNDLVGERCGPGFVVYAGEHEQTVDVVKLVNYMHAGRLLATPHG